MVSIFFAFSEGISASKSTGNPGTFHLHPFAHLGYRDRYQSQQSHLWHLSMRTVRRWYRFRYVPSPVAPHSWKPAAERPTNKDRARIDFFIHNPQVKMAFLCCVLCCVFAGSFMQVLCHLDDSSNIQTLKYVNKTLHYCPKVEDSRYSG
ncbi:Uncharacterised protein [Escherichia coli]|uniref:Uncharacterized protein n=1 Tax=Escherichia coli TaxID=562 RepID=A0A484X390_ECOLX|nr:Uncharacterised protein [Escherichia coli]